MGGKHAIFLDTYRQTHIHIFIYTDINIIRYIYIYIYNIHTFFVDMKFKYVYFV